MNKYQENLIIRSKIIRAIRDFFHDKDFIEIETPVMIKAPAPEEYIEAVTTQKNHFLRTSPELQMKKLLCSNNVNFSKIFQIGSCFRSDEHGRKHREEFTMLEWYQTGTDYEDLMAFIKELLISIAQKVFNKKSIIYQGKEINLTEPWQKISVNEAFDFFTDTNVTEALKNNDFDFLMIDKIEPSLGLKSPAILYDYPACCASLSKLKDNDKSIAERFEMYIYGLELANAYSELTNYNEQKQRFSEASNFRSSQQMNEYPEATEFLNALQNGMPECAGCALGIDRLVMIFTDEVDIKNVIHHE